MSGKQDLVKHQREFSMPDYINIDYPDEKILRQSMKQTDSQESLTNYGEKRGFSPQPDITTILSGHRGWVTVEQDTYNRKFAAESY